MTTLVLNVLVIAWVLLLLFGPAYVLRAAGARSVTATAASGLLTLAVLCFIGVAAALLRHGTVIPLRVCCVLLAIAVVVGIIIRFRRARAQGQRLELGINDLAVPGTLLIGVALIAPPLMQLARLNVHFGLATIFNADISNYALYALNVGQAGFANTHHVISTLGPESVNIGHGSQVSSYLAPTILINLVSAATGLAPWQAVFPAIGVALAVTAMSLWALAKAIWPTARYAAGGAAIVGSMASLPSFAAAQYFLGGALGLASVAGGLAGATALGRGGEDDHAGVACLIGGGALGVYAYSELGLPALVAFPVWAVIVQFVLGKRGRAGAIRVLLVGISASMASVLLASVGLQAALNLLKAQRTAAAGFRIPPLTATAAILWPGGIYQAVTPVAMTVSWLILLALVVAGCATAWRSRLRGPAILTAVLAAGSAVVLLGFYASYGFDRYQSWKIEAFMLPMVLAAIVPAIAMIRIRSASLGKAIVLGAVGIVAINPALQWGAAIKVAQLPARHGGQPFFSNRALVNLADSPELKKLQSVNIHLGPFTETELAASIVPVPTVNFTAPTYFGLTGPIRTCTLTRTDLTTDRSGAVDLGGGYILVPRPYPCQLKP